LSEMEIDPRAMHLTCNTLGNKTVDIAHKT